MDSNFLEVFICLISSFMHTITLYVLRDKLNGNFISGGTLMRKKSVLEQVLDLLYPQHELKIAKKLGRFVRKLASHADSVDELEEIARILQREVDAIRWGLDSITHKDKQEDSATNDS